MCVLFLCLQLEVVEDDKVLRSLLSDDPAGFVYASGFSTPITQVTMDDIPLLLKIICVHSCVVPIKAELDQLKEGLNLFNVIDILKDLGLEEHD